MLDAYNSTLAYRLVFGLTFFAALALWELVRNGSRSSRLREYAFLLFTTVVSVGFGVIHDHVTAALSSDYFLFAKGLVDDSRPYRLAVTILAVKASYWVGLVLGTALLVANNPSRRLPQLGYASLVRLTAVPLVTAVIFAVLLGTGFRVADFGQRGTASALAGPSGAPNFLLVWGIHAGSYLGALVGGTGAVAVVIRRRRSAATAPPVVTGG